MNLLTPRVTNKKTKKKLLTKETKEETKEERNERRRTNRWVYIHVTALNENDLYVVSIILIFSNINTNEYFFIFFWILFSMLFIYMIRY